MNDTIEFANGFIIDSATVYGGSEQYQQAIRNTLQIEAPAEAISFDDLKALSQNKDALSRIVITDKESGGSFTYHDYILPMMISFTNKEGKDVISMKIAQKSTIEMEHEQKMNEMQMAMIELAGMVAGGDSNG